jgi:hypothetical protein
LIFLILSWRTLGRSNLQQSSNYESTGKWLVWGIVIVIVVIIVGAIVIAVSFVSSIIASGIPPPVQNGTTPINPFQQIPGFQNFLYQLWEVTAFGYAIWLSVWLKMCYSIKALAKDIIQPKLIATGNLYIVSYALGFVSVLWLFSLSGSLFLTATRTVNPSNSLLYGSFYGFFLGGYWPVYTSVSLGEDVIILLGSYLGYKSLNNALTSLGFPKPPAPPAFPSPQQQMSRNYCPRCGHKLNDPNLSSCPDCGTTLS